MPSITTVAKAAPTLPRPAPYPPTIGAWWDHHHRSDPTLHHFCKESTIPLYCPFPATLGLDFRPHALETHSKLGRKLGITKNPKFALAAEPRYDEGETMDVILTSIVGAASCLSVLPGSEVPWMPLSWQDGPREQPLHCETPGTRSINHVRPPAPPEQESLHPAPTAAPPARCHRQDLGLEEAARVGPRRENMTWRSNVRGPIWVSNRCCWAYDDS
jgi:hypothetical protein